MMHGAVYLLAVIWTAGLIAVAAVAVVRTRAALDRIVALDTMVLTVVALLLILSAGQRSATYTAAAVALAGLAFAATIAAARYHGGREPFG